MGVLVCGIAYKSDGTTTAPSGTLVRLMIKDSGGTWYAAYSTNCGANGVYCFTNVEAAAYSPKLGSPGTACWVTTAHVLPLLVGGAPMGMPVTMLVGSGDFT